MGDSEIRALERLVQSGDEAALSQLVRELQRRGDFEVILARLRALLTSAQDQSRGVHLRGDLTVFQVVEAVRRLVRPERPADELPWQLVLKRELLSQQRSPHWRFEVAYAAVALEGAEVRIAAGRAEPDALATFDRELSDRKTGGLTVFAMSERASYSIPLIEQLTLPRTTALAWVRWCESDPRTQPRDERIEQVRLRPAMYIGSTAAAGLYQIVEECLLDVIAEFHEGSVSETTLTLREDGSIEVSDDGAGIPVSARDTGSPPPLVACYTNLGSRGRSREERSDAFYPGLMGVGVACVNYLSAWFEVETAREGELWRQRFEQGQPSSRLLALGKTDRRGTVVRFLPDPTIFSARRIDFVALSSRMEELSHLCPRLGFRLIEEASGRSVTYRSDRGVRDLVTKMVAGERSIVEPMFSVTGTVDSSYSGGPVLVDVALAWTHGDIERIQSFVNFGPTTRGGTHVEGFAEALGAVLDDPRTKALLPDGFRVPTAAEARLGLNAAIAVRVPHPQFPGSTRSLLGNPDIRGVVRQVVEPALSRYVQSQPRLVKALALRAGRARASGR